MTTAEAVATTTTTCLGLGALAKQMDLFPDKLIPALVAAAGTLLVPALAGWNVMNAIAGFSAGLGATGVNQLYRQSRPETKDQPPTQ